jgi:hypothetical protein
MELTEKKMKVEKKIERAKKMIAKMGVNKYVEHLMKKRK